MGRIVAEERTIGSVTKTLGYGYNLDGSLASVTYPSGRTVNYAPSAVGRPLTAIDTADNITYVGSANATYAPQGALATAAYGANISLSASYNNRLLPSNLEGYTSSATIFQLQPAYNPNGTVSSVTNGVNSARTQTFTYDYLNRITSASSAATLGTYCWGQSIPTNGTGYDRYGNLLVINNTGTGSGCWSLPVLSVSVNTYNQITNSGFSYDAAGNMTGDGSYSYAWNGEGLLKSAGTTTYTYDGDKKRVEKSSGTYYWLSPSGSVLAETDSSGDTQNEYIYFSGGRTARRDSSGNVYYYFQDQIGSSRLIATSGGTVCYDADYTPFGYEMAYVTTCSQNYKFTGMERDVETGNDHAWFRNYEQNLGRWMSPDPAGLMAVDPSNPQTWNGYAYVVNDPCSLTDALGLKYLCTLNVAVNNSGLISPSQLNTLMQTLGDVFATADVGVSFNFSGPADYSLDVTTSAAGLGYHQSVPGLIQGTPQDVNAIGETPGWGNYIANYGMVYVDRLMVAGYSGASLATALGWAGAHEAGHYLLHIGDNPDNLGIMLPMYDKYWWPGFSPGNATLLRDKCNKLHRPPSTALPSGGGSGGSGTASGYLGPIYGCGNESCGIVDWYYGGGLPPPQAGGKMPPPPTL
jgi:RHS repeat-associated protein